MESVALTPAHLILEEVSMLVAIEGNDNTGELVAASFMNNLYETPVLIVGNAVPTPK